MPFNSNATQHGDEGGGKSNSSATIDLKALQELAREFYKLLNIAENDPNAPLQIEVTSDGLKVTLFNRSSQPLFVTDSTEFTEWGVLAVQNLAWLIDRQKFRVIVEGHTRAGIATGREGYSEWDLSTDQANAVRRALTYYAVDPARFARVSGYGAMQPLSGESVDSARNQRIVLSLSLANKMTDDREADSQRRNRSTPAPSPAAKPASSATPRTAEP
jgi:chemotaxis protein MotB